MCFDGQTRTAAHEMWCAADTATTKSTPCPSGGPRVLMGPPGPWPMILSVILLYNYDVLSVLWSLSAKHSYVRTMHLWFAASGV